MLSTHKPKSVRETAEAERAGLLRSTKLASSEFTTSTFAPKMHIIDTFLSVGILWFLITLFTRSTNSSQSLTET